MSSRSKSTALQRPLALLYPLKVNCQNETTTEVSPTEEPIEESVDPTEKFPPEGVSREDITPIQPR